LPLVYQELRQLAAQKLAQEKPGQTLEATALVHEAYLRLVDAKKAQHWDSRGHFFAAATTVSANRKCEPKRLSQLFRREMDWIVMKALEKDRNRRYDTASSFAADVQRFLDDEPVQACQPRLVQRAAKWSRRHRAVVGTGIAGLIVALLILVICALLILSAYQSEAKERQRAVTALYHSRVEEAQEIRRAKPDGYRTKAWQLLQEARELETPDKDLNQLRQEAVACMGDFVGFDPITWNNFPAEVMTIAMHPNGRLLVIGLENGRVLFWDLGIGAATAQLPPHSRPVTSVAFTPDGARVVSGDSEGTIHICEAKANGEWALARTIRAEPMLVGLVPSTAFPFFVPHFVFPGLSNIAVTPDSTQLAVLQEYVIPGYQSLPSTITLRNLADGALIARVRRARALEWIRGVAFGLDGSLSTCYLRYARDGSSFRVQHGILLWGPDKGLEPRELPLDLGLVNTAQFSPDGKLLACACEEGLAVLDTTTLQCHAFPQAERTASVAFSPDSRFMAIANELLGQVRLWNVTSNREIAVLGNPSRLADTIHSIACSGNALVAASRRAVHKWNLVGSGEKIKLAGHRMAVTSIAFTPDGKLLASASKDRVLKIWDPSTGRLLRQLPDFGAEVETLAFSPDGKMLATGDWAGAIQIWDVASGIPLAALPDHGLGRRIWSVAFSPDGRYFAACGGGWFSGAKRGLTLWRIKPGRTIQGTHFILKFQRVPGPTANWAVCTAFSADSQLLAWTEWRDHTVHLWDLEKACARPFHAAPVLGVYRSLAFDSANKYLMFVAKETGLAEGWDVTSGRKAFTIAGQETKNGKDTAHLDCIIALSSDGGRLAGICGRNVTVWDTAGGRLLLKLPEEQGLIYCLAWSPDREHLAVGTSDGGLAIWILREIKAQLDQIGLGW
jgi:WD40 repeat protein